MTAKSPENPYLHVVGIGPGGRGYMTCQATKILEEAECIAGYDLYIDLLPADLRKYKKIIRSGMRHERERCRLAIEAARDGLRTALVCSGDPGIYALAGLTIEILQELSLLEKVPLAIVPGVPAMCAAAARLGAPLGHDFACISLSDLLTPWALIEKRLHNVLLADFVCVLYNPRSRGRPDYLQQALACAGQYRNPECPVGLARNVGRSDEKIEICQLADFDCARVDMLSLVIIGNTESRLAGPYMLTPRGYDRLSLK